MAQFVIGLATMYSLIGSGRAQDHLKLNLLRTSESFTDFGPLATVVVKPTVGDNFPDIYTDLGTVPEAYLKKLRLNTAGIQQYDSFDEFSGELWNALQINKKGTKADSAVIKRTATVASGHFVNTWHNIKHLREARCFSVIFWSTVSPLFAAGIH
ncbi:hypothetical protein VNO77_20045 [Canavalia gladiata]|uniref:Uncharacterized protein n=1 Tax=Canavalia gladiata TaxID=3824 RepID=A0AAN9LSQ0_CANGL